jgi:MFS family permease
MTRDDAQKLADLSPAQWRSGIAAWLGWLFDGLDMHLYTLVAVEFVATLTQLESTSPEVKMKVGWIQAAFLFGWAIGGAVFGVIGDRLGRSRALILTILTYACFTGMSYFATQWWHLLIYRFLAALGIGGEWAVGAAILSETWPRKWRPWLAATLQTGVNCGVLLAMAAGSLISYTADYQRNVFLIGIAPAILVLWIRKAVPEPETWHTAAQNTTHPSVFELLHGSTRRITLLTTSVCALTLTAHWAFMFWCTQHIAAVAQQQGIQPSEITRMKALAIVILSVSSIFGNYLAGWLAKRLGGYRPAIFLFCLFYFAAISSTYYKPRGYPEILYWLPLMGASQGVFALFTMYLPPLFPTLLRTTGAGFCYNVGRIFAAIGTVLFAMGTVVADYRQALFSSAFLFLPAAIIAWQLPEPPDEPPPLEPASLGNR